MSENFETAKQSLLEVEKKIAIKENQGVTATIDFLKGIPVLGSFIDIGDNLTTNLLSDFQQKKRDELLNIITSSSEMITSDMVNDVGFILNFIKTVDSVNRLATNDKVKYFANLLKNGYLSSSRIESNDFDEYFQILTELSYKQIKYLCLYNKCKKEREIIEDSTDCTDTIEGKFKKILKAEGVETSQIIDSIHRTIFMNELTGTFIGYEGGAYYLVDEFDRFAKWIVGDDSE